MRKPARQAHLLMWLILAPTTVAAAIVALNAAPETVVFSEPPAAILE
ncbi:MAG: hypothetical protein AAF224_12080 [Pseudomonadota bacterium]